MSIKLRPGASYYANICTGRRGYDSTQKVITIVSIHEKAVLVEDLYDNLSLLNHTDIERAGEIQLYYLVWPKSDPSSEPILRRGKPTDRENFHVVCVYNKTVPDFSISW